MRVAYLNSFENEDRTKMLKLNPTKRRKVVNILLLQTPKVNSAFFFLYMQGEAFTSSWSIVCLSPFGPKNDG